MLCIFHHIKDLRKQKSIPIWIGFSKSRIPQVKDGTNMTEFILLWKSSETEHRGFPGGTMVKNPLGQCGGHRFEPWSRKIPHATEQLSLCATTTEPALYSP